MQQWGRLNSRGQVLSSAWSYILPVLDSLTGVQLCAQQRVLSGVCPSVGMCCSCKKRNKSAILLEARNKVSVERVPWTEYVLCSGMIWKENRKDKNNAHRDSPAFWKEGLNGAAQDLWHLGTGSESRGKHGLSWYSVGSSRRFYRRSPWFRVQISWRPREVLAVWAFFGTEDPVRIQ